MHLLTVALSTHTNSSTSVKERTAMTFPLPFACKEFSKVLWIWKASLIVCLGWITFWDIYKLCALIFFATNLYSKFTCCSHSFPTQSLTTKEKKTKASKREAELTPCVICVCTSVHTLVHECWRLLSWCYRLRLREVNFNIWTIIEAVKNSQTLPLYKCLGKYALYYLYVNINTDSLGILLMFCSGSLQQLTNQEVLKCKKDWKEFIKPLQAGISLTFPNPYLIRACLIPYNTIFYSYY